MTYKLCAINSIWVFYYVACIKRNRDAINIVFKRKTELIAQFWQRYMRVEEAYTKCLTAFCADSLQVYFKTKPTILTCHDKHVGFQLNT